MKAKTSYKIIFLFVFFGNNLFALNDDSTHETEFW